jgi:hypothetical protein
MPTRKRLEPGQLKKTFLIFAAMLFVLSPMVGHPVRAACIDFLRNTILSAKRGYIAYAAEDLSFKPLRVIDSNTGGFVQLTLQERVGLGSRGAVYRLRGGEFGVDAVAKVQKRYRLPTPEKYDQIADESIEREARVTSLLRERMAEIEKSPFYPTNAPWKAGEFPVIPILKEYQSDWGAVLIKPEVRTGKKVQSLRLNDRGELPQEIQLGLREIYQLHLAVHDRIRALPGTATEGVGMRIDIGASNLVWIEDASELKRLKMSRPGFFLFEVDQSSTHFLTPPDLNHHRFPTFDSYLDEFMQEMRR